MKTQFYGWALIISGSLAAVQLPASLQKTGGNGLQPLLTSKHISSTVTGPFGLIYSRNSWTSTGDFVTTGNTTATLSGNYVNISSATQDDWNNTVHITGYQTKLEKWRFKLRFKIAAWAGNSYGIGFGLKSANSYVQNDIMGFLQTTNSATGGLYILKSGRTVLAAGPSMSIALNDVIDMEGVFYDSVFHFTATNITSGSSANMSFTFATNGSTQLVPNTSYFSLMELGGTHQVQNIEISSDELSGANLVTIGDSKTIGYFSNTFAGRYAAQLNANYPAALINAGGADRVTHVLNRQEELIRLAANKYLLSIGSNDIRFGSTLAELQTNYDSLVRLLLGTGAAVYHIVLPEDYTKPLGVNLEAFKDWVAATYPANYINVWDSMATGGLLKGIYDTGDGVHLNQAANNKIYEAILASNKLGGGVTLPVRLLSFDAKKINPNKAEISWKTDPSLQAELYEIWKSQDGTQFEKIASFPSNGNSSYYFVDNNLLSGINYYKLSMKEITGGISYSKVVSVENDPSGIRVVGWKKLNVNEFEFYLDCRVPAMIDWEYVDISGRKVKKGTQQIHKGSNTIRISVANFNKGVYYLQIFSEGAQEKISFPFIN